MRDLEKQIIDKMEELNKKGLSDDEAKIETELKELLKKLMKESFGKATAEFLYHDALKKYSKHISRDQSVIFRLLIEKYLIAPDAALKAECLTNIEDKIRRIRKETFKPNGQGLLPKDISRELIRGFIFLGTKN